MILSQEFMGLFGLSIVAVNTVLITADLGGWARVLSRFRRETRSGSGRLTRGALRGEQGTPRVDLVLVAHSRGNGKIFFHGRDPVAQVPEGVRIYPEGSAAELSLEAGAEPWVWPDETSLTRALACPDQRTFDELAPAAERAKGVERAVSIDLDATAPVYVVGSASNGTVTPATTSLDPAGTSHLIIAAFDPRAWAARQIRLITAGIVSIWAVFAALTALCFQGVPFGLESKLGALGLFAFFLLVQPVGVAIRERTSLPHQVPHNPLWTRPRPSATRAADVTASPRPAP
jgi:hypothetical protein